MNKNKHMYDDDLMKELGEIMKDYIVFNGYSNIGQAEDDFLEEDEYQTAFFTYNEQENDERLPGIKEFNEPGIIEFNTATLTRSEEEK